MKSEKIDLNNMQNSNDFEAVAAAVEGQLPTGAMLFDKSLLPSRGKFYPETIYVKKMNTKNIKNLSTITEQNANYIFNTILTNCVLGIDTNKILIGDKLWFIYYLRALTFDDRPVIIKHKCEHCGSNVVLEYRLKNLMVEYLDKEVPPAITLDNGDVIATKFPDIASEIQTARLKNSDDIIENIESDLLDFAVNIASINGKKVKLMEAYEYVCNMDASCFADLVQTMSTFMFTVKPYGEFQCPECGETVIEKIAFTPSFFLPKKV